jgi:AraC-type transcriptional regulator
MQKQNKTAALKPNQAPELRAELARQIARFVGKEENRITEIPGVSLHRRTSPTPRCRATYHPGIIVVAQGRKQVNLGKASFIYDDSRFLLTAVDFSKIVSCGCRLCLGNRLPTSAKNKQRTGR